ncbi:MAG TPA: hypothetical protein VL294_04800 [Pseudolysinimonas sp.]|jgi:hypothetical protein|nr:hypothetical protein [Pseudolysinimonas sp.]
MTLDAEAFRVAVRNSTHADRMKLIESEVLDRDPFAFSDDMDLYSRLQRHLEKALGAEPGSVALVGSAAVGFSIAPDNFTRPFHEKSDLDFVVVSPQLFDAAWSVLLRWGHPVRHHIPAEAAAWFKARSDEIFWGWLDPEELRFSGVTKPTLLRDLRDLKTAWFSAFRALGKSFPEPVISARPASARLYRSRMHLIHYQANGLGKVASHLKRES